MTTIEVAGSRSIGQAAWLIPHCVSLVLLELDAAYALADASRDARNTRHILGWLETDSHLVAVVLATDRRPVHTRADLCPQDHATFCNPPGLFGGVRMLEAGREIRAAKIGRRVTVHSRGSTGSDSIARTANTASCTRHSGSPRAARSSDSRPSAYSRAASERLCPRFRGRSRRGSPARCSRGRR